LNSAIIGYLKLASAYSMFPAYSVKARAPRLQG